MSMEFIEECAKAYAGARETLAAEVEDLESAITALKRERLPVVRGKILFAASAKAALVEAVEGAPDLFKRPKTRILHGIRLGYAKGKGKVSFADAKKVVARIRRHFPRKFKALVKVTETPIKTALAAQPATALKKLGVTVTDAEDQVLIKPTDSEIDKLVDALLAGAEEGAKS